MESGEGNSEYLGKKSKKTSALWCQFLQEHGIFLDCDHALPRCSRQEWVHIRLFIIADYCYLFVGLCGKMWFCHMSSVLVIVYFTQVTGLNLQNIDCPMLWINLLLHEAFVYFIFRPCSPRFKLPIRVVNSVSFVYWPTTPGHGSCPGCVVGISSISPLKKTNQNFPFLASIICK